MTVFVNARHIPGRLLITNSVEIISHEALADEARQNCLRLGHHPLLWSQTI